MRKGRFWEALRRAAALYGEADIAVYATSGAYYLFLSLWPLAVLLLALLPYLSVTEQQLLDAVLGYAPESFQRLMNTIVSEAYSGSATAVGLSLAVELWSAGKFLSSLMRGLGEIYDGGPGGGFIRRRLLGALYTAALLLFVVVNLALLLFGERLAAAAAEMAPGLEKLWRLLLRGRGLVFLGGVTVVNALLFCYVPRRKLTFRGQLPGAAFGAVVWLSFSRVYSWAVERFHFFSVYGSLAITIISMFWMYYSLYILFLGAWLNTLPGRLRAEGNRERFHG